MTTNDEPPKRRRLRKYKADPEGFGNIDITERDVEILDLVYRYRYVYAKHVHALVDGNNRHLARRLQGLFHRKFLGRRVPPARLRLAGSPKMAYVLETAGAKLLADRVYQVAMGELTWRKAQNDRTEWFLLHQIEISTFHAALELALEEAPGLELLDWRQGQEAHGKCAWKLPRWSDAERFFVAPDAYVAVAEAGVQRNFFLELDRGTEESRRIHEKLEDYAWYLTHPDYRNQYPERPEDVRVLFVTTGGEERLQNMMDALENLVNGYDYKGRRYRKVPGLVPGWFWFTRASEYNLAEPATVLGPIWRTVKNRKKTLTLFK